MPRRTRAWLRFGDRGQGQAPTLTPVAAEGQARPTCLRRGSSPGYAARRPLAGVALPRPPPRPTR